MRDPGKWLEEAEQAVIVVQPGDPRVAEWRRKDWPICQVLSSSQNLEGTFPIAVGGTPYSLFSTAKEKPPQQVLVIVDSLKQQDDVLREVALGMMDSPLYR